MRVLKTANLNTMFTYIPYHSDAESFHQYHRKPHQGLDSATSNVTVCKKNIIHGINVKVFKILTETNQ